jgi:presqualene diphosphate synthase
MSQAVDAASPPPTASHSASGSSFYAAMRILPAAQRDAMFEIYRFCREVDDIADSNGPRPLRIGQLGEWQDFLTVIDGMEMDAREDIRAPSFAMLDLYCDRVASAVGRLSVRVFGVEEDDGILLSHHLGRALQLTNILRDLDEDAGIGRLYLPREAMDQAGIATGDPLTALRSPNLSQACAPLVERARTHFVEADRVMKRCPRRAVKAPRIMAEVYRSMLEGMIVRGWSAPRERVSVSRTRLAWIILRYAFI